MELGNISSPNKQSGTGTGRPGSVGREFGGGSLPIEVFWNHGDVALGDMVRGHRGMGWES